LKILVLGSSGMLGTALTRTFSQVNYCDVIGTVRSDKSVENLSKLKKVQIISDIDCEDDKKIFQLFELIKPDVVINCVGLIKQLVDVKDPLKTTLLNSVLPHKLSHLCKIIGARFIHISTDCVFSGQKGLYTEKDYPDAKDLYGRSKLMGEVDYPNAITLRTSIIGHEFNSSNSLINWFLSQNEVINGFKKAIFSGLPAIEMAQIIENYVLPFPKLTGLFHVSVDPISKYDLLTMVKKIYKKKIVIVPDNTLMIDRSLNSDNFRAATGFTPKSWPEMIKSMYKYK